MFELVFDRISWFMCCMLFLVRFMSGLIDVCLFLFFLSGMMMFNESIFVIMLFDNSEGVKGVVRGDLFCLVVFRENEYCGRVCVD